MKKLIFLIIAVVMSTNVYAYAAAKGQDFNSNTGIITPDVAIGGKRFYSDRVTISREGYMLYCGGDGIKNNRCYSNGVESPNLWSTFEQMVPYGRKYVGFRLVSGAYGYPYYEIFWK